MTPEEKAKAYDEALKRAREIKEKIMYSHLSTESCKAVSEYIDEIIPELRESEDERIRKWLYDYIERVGKTWGKPGPFDYTQILAWLEKQKENPKSADSIPSDCVSDAKCEDRWHKVGDSLPDNPREVLCKDEAGNYFIGRYYVGEGWDISNYDDEDKPHHLNPPVSKWIDFPSEKQKEQKEIPLMNGDADLYFDNWIQHNDTTKRGCFEEGMRYAQRLQKEQKPEDTVPVRFEEEDGEKYPVVDYKLMGQKPAEWSEEDSKRYISIGTTLETSVVLSKEDYDANMAWLRELVNAKKYSGPQSHWKPSEEQMEALGYAISGDFDKIKPTSYLSRRLEEIEKQLKLM